MADAEFNELQHDRFHSGNRDAAVDAADHLEQDLERGGFLANSEELCISESDRSQEKILFIFTLGSFEGGFGPQVITRHGIQFLSLDRTSRLRKGSDKQVHRANTAGLAAEIKISRRIAAIGSTRK